MDIDNHTELDATLPPLPLGAGHLVAASGHCPEGDSAVMHVVSPEEERALLQISRRHPVVRWQGGATAILDHAMRRAKGSGGKWILACSSHPVVLPMMAWRGRSEFHIAYGGRMRTPAELPPFVAESATEAHFDDWIATLLKHHCAD